jgi:hypothetical protein
MYLFVELWKPKQAWLDLSTAERAAYFEPLGPVIGGLVEQGLDIIGWSINDAVTDMRGDYTYIGAYRMPNLEFAETFEKTVRSVGWYDYFEQINARGPLMAPPDVLGHSIGL